MEALNYALPATAGDWIDPNLKPMKQATFDLGFDYSVRSNLVLSLRYTDRRLIRTIEDIGTITPQGESYMIGNPGFGVVADPANWGPGIPTTPKAKRNYDALEVRLDRRFSRKYQFSIIYAYSRILESPDIGDAAQLDHLLKYPGAAFLHICRRRTGLQAQRFGQDGSQKRRLLGPEVRRRLPEIAPTGRLETKYPIPQLHDVQIYFEDAALGPGKFDHRGEIGLEAFAHEAAARPQKHVFGHLLRNRAGTAQALPVLVRIERVLDRSEIEAVVGCEVLILRGDDGQRGLRRDPVPGHPLIVHMTRTAGSPGFDPALYHHRRSGRGNPAQSQSRQHRGDQDNNENLDRTPGCDGKGIAGDGRPARVRT